ncbi:MAG: hypothetical protein ACR2LQ_08495 [Acidimicrobiales bacterium]
MDVPAGTNVEAEIDGQTFGPHAIDQMQGRGIPPSAVNDAISNGQAVTGIDGRTIYYSSANNISVVVENGRVVTVSYGQFKPR